jgi:hypothetical protein
LGAAEGVIERGRSIPDKLRHCPEKCVMQRRNTRNALIFKALPALRRCVTRLIKHSHCFASTRIKPF